MNGMSPAQAVPFHTNSTQHSRNGSVTQAGSGRQGCVFTLQQYGLGRQAAQALLVKHEICR